MKKGKKGKGVKKGPDSRSGGIRDSAATASQAGDDEATKVS
jgi:hypothetical protein